ncbi:MAG: UTRA domain-containing protein [Rhizobiales bacterium]|nr:UTRA domain-containing protein [Hyphomicrobiales bacterium]
MQNKIPEAEILHDIKLDGNGPLTKQIIRAISNNIASGKFKTGSLLPSEVSLAEQLNISRQTVHKAMSILSKDGIVERRKKAGTFIAEQKAFMLPVRDISDDIKSSNRQYGYKIIDRDVVINGQDGFEWPLVSKGTLVERLTCLHFADDEAIQLEIRMINLEMAPDFAKEDFETISPTKWLLQHVPWSNVEHEISAIAASKDIAEKLDCDLDQACLVVRRSTSYKNQAITCTELISVGGKSNLKGLHTPIA